MLYRCIEDTTDTWNSTSWEATNVGKEFVQVTSSLTDIAPVYLGSVTNIYFRYAKWGGTLNAGSTKNLGNINSYIPDEYSLIGILLTPTADSHVSMTWKTDESGNVNIYAYSETYSGTFQYDALLILRK